jgi:primosomal protein N' (replication factor Y)
MAVTHRMRGEDPVTTERAKRLRRDATEAEKRLWGALRNRQLADCKFVWQAPIGPYFADFCCRERGLIIEADGGQHAYSDHDQRRDAFLRAAGYRVMRFWNHDIMANREGVLEAILMELTTRE